ncbi:MAG: Mrp/NBP35 family ATP-binding protein [Firmicutes bacterium]|nr:Mrp/NBP35 family ATP-binding protein [Bacillota bacterium]
MIDRQQVMDALAEVHDPELHKSIVELNMVRDVQIDGRNVKVTVALKTAGCPLKDTIRRSVEERLARIPGVGRVEVELGAMTPEERAAMFAAKFSSPITAPDSKTQVIGVASGKGGVGKSTVTVNLAAALRKQGYAVGVLDCDIYGFSVPRMVGIEGVKPTVLDGKILPIPAHGMKVMSIGNFVPDNSPVIWRGPMLGKILRQFLTDVVWGELDFLLLDLPPGTGDMALDVAQLLPNSTLLIVTTPQVVAAGVASRAAQMSFKTNQRILGVVENMSAFVCPCCGEKTPIFGEGGGQKLAEELNVPLLAQLPLTMEARTLGDEGTPVAIAGEGVMAEAFAELAERVAAAVQQPAGQGGK